MNSCPFYSYLWKKKIIFLPLGVAHKKQIQLPAKHKHDQALERAIKTSHVVAERGRSLCWRTVTPINKHRVSGQPGSQEHSQASPWWARRRGRAFPGKKKMQLLLLQGHFCKHRAAAAAACTAQTPEQLTAASAVWCTSSTQEKLLRNSGRDIWTKVIENCMPLGGLEKTSAGNSAVFNELLDY